jgi:tetratricopeptide (TPR) repeat protein
MAAMWSRRLAWGALLCLCFTVLPALTFGAPAEAQRSRRQRGNPLIQQGQSLYDDLRFEEGLQVLSAALIRAGNTPQDRVTIYSLLAFTYLALGREEEAAGAYQSLLGIEPEHEVGSDVSPRTRSFFEQVRQRWEDAGRPGFSTSPPAPVEIRHRSPAQADRNEAVTLTARVEDPSGRVARLVLAYRQGTSDVFQRVETEPGEGGLTATIPADDVSPPLVEYYFEALDAQGLPIAARGDVAAPLRIAVPEPSNSVFRKWWFWTVAAVVVGGAVTTAVVLSGGGRTPTEQGTLLITVR